VAQQAEIPQIGPALLNLIQVTGNILLLQLTQLGNILTLTSILILNLFNTGIARLIGRNQTFLALSM
jgi:hypothetical protein